MEQQMSKEQQEFMEKSNAHRSEKVEELAYKLLAVSLKQDIPVFDLPYYVIQRSRQIIEEAFKKVDFNNKELIKARKAFLRKCLKSVKENISLLPIKKEERNETDDRNDRCEPVAQALAHLLLDSDLIFSDKNYFDKILANEESIPLSSAIAGYSNALDEKLLMVIGEHWRKATEKMFGVEKEKLTFKMMDDILKGT